MARAKRGFKARRRRKKIMAMAKGFRGSRRSRFRTAIHVVRRALKFAFRDRKVRARDFRSLWITRINASCRAAGLRYSEFVHGLKKANIALDRSILADLALREPEHFKSLVDTAKSAIKST